VVFATLAGRTAAAEEPPTIVHVRSSNAPLDKRLDAELGALGFTVSIVEPVDPSLDLEAVTRSHGGAAGIRVDSGDVVELWVLPTHAGDPPVHETVRVDAQRGWTAAAVSALESLRARLLEIRSAPLLPPPPPSVEPAPAPLPAPSSPPPPRRWLWLHLGAGIDASPGGSPPGADVLVEVRGEPCPWLSFGAFGAGTPLSAEIDAPEGRASVRRVLAGIALDAQGTLGPVTLAAGAGAALAPTFVHGTYAAPGFATRDSTSLSAAPVLRLSASFALAPPLRIRIALAGGATFPEATTTFGDHVVATWGRPFGLGTIGVEWGIAAAR
jgi:hypothetical protein